MKCILCKEEKTGTFFKVDMNGGYNTPVIQTFCESCYHKSGWDGVWKILDIILGEEQR